MKTILRFCLGSALLLLLTTSAWADPPRSPTSAAGATTSPATPEVSPTEGVVNINSATDEELQRLPGIGPARATAIVQLRERVHRFNHTEDLLRVRGIGRVGFRRMRPYLSLNGDTTLLARPGRPVPSTPAP